MCEKTKQWPSQFPRAPVYFVQPTCLKKKKQTAGTRKCLVGFALIKKVIHLIFELFYNYFSIDCFQWLSSILV